MSIAQAAWFKDKSGPVIRHPLPSLIGTAGIRHIAAMSVSSDPLDTARAALQPGEELVWADRPDPQALARSKLPQVIRGVLGFVVIGVFSWLSFLPAWPGGPGGAVFAFFLILALLYCLWLVAAPLIARRAAAQTVYAVTDRRALILEGWPLRRLRAFGPSDLDEALVAPGTAGRGSVVFVNRKRPWWRRSAGGTYQFEAFFGIADAQRVSQVIETLRTGAGAAQMPDEDA